MSDSGAKAWLQKTWVQCTLLYLVVASFYVYNASPQPGYVDSGMVAANVYSMRVSSWVNVHLLHNIVGRFWLFVFPFGEVGWRLVIFGGLVSAGAIVNLYRLLLALDVSVKNALVAAIGTALAHGVWWHAVTIEVYPVNAFFTPLICLQILRYEREQELRFYYRAAFYYGLSAVNHVLMGLFLFAFIGSVLNKKGAKAILQPVVMAKTLGWFVLGWQPALLVLFNDVVNATNRGAYIDAAGQVQLPVGDAIRTVLDQATGGQFKNQMFVEGGQFGGTLKWIKAGLLALVIDFPNLLLPLAPIGMFALWRRAELRMTVMFIFGGFLANFVWVLNYAVWDQWAFAIPSWMLWGLFAGLGLEWLGQRLVTQGRQRVAQGLLAATVASLAVGPWLYAKVEDWAREEGGFWNGYFDFFDEYQESFRASDYFASPYKRGWDQPRRFVERLWDIYPQGAVVYDDHTRSWFLFHLYYNAVLAERRDLVNWNTGLAGDWVQTVQPHGERFIADVTAGKPVFLTSLYRFPGRAIIAYVVARAHGLEAEQLRALGGQPVEKLLEQVPQLEIETHTVMEGEPFEVYEVRLKPGTLLAIERIQEHALGLVQAPAHGEFGLQPDPDKDGGQALVWSGGQAQDRAVVAFSSPRAARFGVRMKVSGQGWQAPSLDGSAQARETGDGMWDFGAFEFTEGLHQITFAATGPASFELDYVELVPVP